MPRRSLPLIGAQVSTAGGLAPVPQRAIDIGAEVVQVFDTNPRTWRPRVASDEEIATFSAGLARHRLPLFLHTIYLINLASPDQALRLRSQEALTRALVLGARTGAAAVVTHVGSHRGAGFERARAWVAGAVAGALADAAETATKMAAQGGGGGGGALPSRSGTRAAAAPAAPLPTLLLESGAGAGDTVGDGLEALASLLEAFSDAALLTDGDVGLCLDTAHLFASGYAVHETEGLDALVADLRRLGLLDRVKLVHLNDSKAPFAVHRDRHENLAQGHIGYEGLARVLRHPAFAHIPFVLEVPGHDGRGPDAANVALAKAMRAGAAAPRAAPAPAETRRAKPG